MLSASWEQYFLGGLKTNLCHLAESCKHELVLSFTQTLFGPKKEILLTSATQLTFIPSLTYVASIRKFTSNISKSACWKCQESIFNTWDYLQGLDVNFSCQVMTSNLENNDTWFLDLTEGKQLCLSSAFWLTSFLLYSSLKLYSSTAYSSTACPQFIDGSSTLLYNSYIF